MVGLPIPLPAQNVADRQTPPPASTPGFLEQAARLLEEYRTEALASWVWRLAQHPPQADWPELLLHDVLADVPVLVEAVLATLRAGTTDALLVSRSDVVTNVQRQVSLRLGQGTPLAVVLNEQALLRDELWVLFTHRLPTASHPAEMLALARALDGALQHVLESCILLGYDEQEQEAA